jgi:hypothetical protein
MRIPSRQTAPRRRRADTDATVMALSGLVLVLILLLAFVSGLALWQWRQATALRAVAAQQGSAGLAISLDGLGPGPDAGGIPAEEEKLAGHVTTLVSSSAAGPWVVLPMLELNLETPPLDPDAPPGAGPGGLP